LRHLDFAKFQGRFFPRGTWICHDLSRHGCQNIGKLLFENIQEKYGKMKPRVGTAIDIAPRNYPVLPPKQQHHQQLKCSQHLGLLEA
jgi:hypothetical protein